MISAPTGLSLELPADTFWSTVGIFDSVCSLPDMGSSVVSMELLPNSSQVEVGPHSIANHKIGPLLRP